MSLIFLFLVNMLDVIIIIIVLIKVIKIKKKVNYKVPRLKRVIKRRLWVYDHIITRTMKQHRNLNTVDTMSLWLTFIEHFQRHIYLCKVDLPCSLKKKKKNWPPCDRVPWRSHPTQNKIKYDNSSLVKLCCYN